MSHPHSLWIPPFGYKEGLIVLAAILVTGTALQLTAGSFPFLLLAFPNNLVLGLALLSAGIATGLLRQNSFTVWLTSPSLAVIVLFGVLLLALLMGLIPQAEVTSATKLLDRLGLTHIPSCWPFVLLDGLAIFMLCTLLTQRLKHVSCIKLPFLLLHAGIAVILFAAGFGAADLHRFIMFVPVGETQWKVFEDNKQSLDLPIAITLHSFTMDEYPPKLVIIDKKNGNPLPTDKPVWLQIIPSHPQGHLLDWELTIDNFIPRAIFTGNGTYTAREMPGASPAAFVRATQDKTGKTVKGWVTHGNMGSFMRTLDLTETQTLVITDPDPMYFASDITLQLKGQPPVKKRIEVNNPLKIGNWTIYQHGYDKLNGRYSTYSSFELVYDPWLPLVYAGFILLALGAFSLIWLRHSPSRTNSSKEYTTL